VSSEKVSNLIDFNLIDLGESAAPAVAALRLSLDFAQVFFPSGLIARLPYGR
jgi:hypothetical protein